ncbi:conserved protein of unknown function (plasmid) [Paraburkholderia dioscoreae]|uniref:Uncharacterized protein n=1 Tax=Paraburkholderia dioscoreae TaxID=2604047 RepID=A0A5Q4ZQY7_9BURK|nr:conserved protein of unknown function [Paraburkholderia dioscoreae]
MQAGSTTIAALAAVVLTGLVYVNCPQIRSLCAEGKALDIVVCAASKIQVACKTEARRKYKMCVKRATCSL